jgi:hypothetical protein
MWRQGPIWEPKDSNFRPNSITALIFFICREVLRPSVRTAHK